MTDAGMLAPCCYQGPCWHLVVTKVTDSLHDPPLFLLSLNLNDAKVPVDLDDENALLGDVDGPVVELLHQLVLVTTEQLVEHLANKLRLNVVKHQLLLLERVEPPDTRCAHSQDENLQLHCVNHELSFPGHCYCAVQCKTSLEFVFLSACS